MKEAVLALELERRYSKDRILEMYLNQVYFGNGAYGVEAASRTYFGKSVSELTVREAALLAGLPRAPSSYSPFEHGEAAKRRREVVLRRMVEYGVLQDAEAQAAGAKSDLGLIPPERRRTTGQYFLEYVQQTLEAKYGADMVFKGGLNVYTTLNPTMQLTAEQALRDGLKALEGRTAKAQHGRASGGRGRHHRAADGLRAGDGRRLRLLPQRVQPRGAGAPAAGLGLQAVRLHRRARSRVHAGHPRGRRARVLRGRPERPGVEARQLRPQVPRAHHAAAGARGIGQRGHGQGPGARRPQQDDPGGAALRHREPAAT